MAAQIVSCVQSLDLNAMHDDTTVTVLKLRSRSVANVMIGPPEHKDDDLSTMRLFFAKEGKHIVCGGTTARAVAEFLGEKVRTLPNTGTDAVPPMSEIKGVDLVTEGVVTLNAALEIIRNYTFDSMQTLELIGQTDGAARLAEALMEDATEINILFGNAVNAAQQDSEFSFEKKLQLIQELQELLRSMGKNVKFSIC